MRLDGLQNRSGRRAEEKILDPTGTFVVQPLYSLSYPGSSHKTKLFITIAVQRNVYLSALGEV
jgi:hypothetical protein